MTGHSVVQRPNWWRRVASIRFLAVLPLFSVTTIWASPGSAQDWQRLDDGRVVIEVFGEKLAFFPEDGQLVQFWKNQSGRTEKFFNLEAAVSDPQSARRRLTELGNDAWVWVTVGNNNYWRQQQQDRKFLGRFDWSEIPTPGSLDGLSFSILHEERHSDGHSRPRSVPNQYFPKAVGPSTSGFVAYPRSGTASAAEQRPRETRYVMKGDQRVDPSESPLVVTCKWVGAAVRLCSSRVVSDDRRVRVLWHWYEDQFPKSEWRELDGRLREITNFVFIERGKGDFE